MQLYSYCFIDFHVHILVVVVVVVVVVRGAVVVVVVVLVVVVVIFSYLIFNYLSSYLGLFFCIKESHVKGGLMLILALAEGLAIFLYRKDLWFCCLLCGKCFVYVA